LEEDVIVDGDGLAVPVVGSWAQKKYRLIQNYASIFAKGMKNKWDCRVYVDLFAGAGKARIRGTQRNVDSSALLSLDIPVKFDLYIFCDKDSNQIEALKKRVKKKFPEANVLYVAGDVNAETERIVSKIPIATRDFKVLSFCVVDPYKMADLKFGTINRLSDFYVDFFVLIPTHMDAHRNEKKYLSPNNNTVSEFLGNSEWRKDWLKAKLKNTPFFTFIIESFNNQMEKLEYHKSEIHDSELISSPDKNLPLYRLALFSRSTVGKKFWEQARKYADPQCKFNFTWKDAEWL
jgi:three-Cys-motif partner protein